MVSQPDLPACLTSQRSPRDEDSTPATVDLGCFNDRVAGAWPLFAEKLRQWLMTNLEPGKISFHLLIVFSIVKLTPRAETFICLPFSALLCAMSQTLLTLFSHEKTEAKRSPPWESLRLQHGAFCHSYTTFGQSVSSMWRSKVMLDHLELELQAGVSHLIDVLGTKLRYSLRMVVPTPRHYATSPAPIFFLTGTQDCTHLWG